MNNDSILKHACSMQLVGTSTNFIVKDMFNDEKFWSIFHQVSFNLDALENVVGPCAPRMSKSYDLLDSLLTEELWSMAIRKGIFGI